MKPFIHAFNSFVASIFIFFIIGMAIAILMIQNQWIDMRFDSEYIVTISLLTGLWLYFLMIFLNAKVFVFWESIFKSMAVGIFCVATILFITIKNGSLAILPAYVARKSLFLEDVLPLNVMNTILMIVIPLGFVWLIFASKKINLPKKEINTEWKQLSPLKKSGMMLLFITIAIFLLLYLGQGGVQDTINHSIKYLKDADVEGFRDYLLSFGPLAAVVSCVLMIFQSIIAPLPAFVITFANGLLFGWIFGAILSWSSAMLGAILCFYLAKFMGRPVVEKIVTKKALQWWDQFFAKYGKQAVFIARIVPIVSFDLVSYAAGVTSISFWQFFWATGLGQLPATILYSYLGQNATNTVKILFFMFTIVIALAVIGMIFRPKWKDWGKRKQGAKG